MKQTLSNFWQFLKSPQLLKLSKDKKQLWRDFWWLLVLDLAVGLFITLIYVILDELKLLHDYKDIDLIKEYGYLGTFFFMCIFAPLLEESLFRWHLRRRYASIYFVFLSTAGIIVWFLSNNLYITLILAFFLVAASISHYLLKKQSQSSKQILWQKCFPFVFYLSACVFGLIHLSNQEGLSLHDPFFLIYICSQLFGGLSLGYLRIKYGLRYSILSHALFNFVAMVLEITFP